MKLNYIKPKVLKSKIDIALYQTQREIHTVAARAGARGPRFKVSSEGLLTEIDILLRSAIQVLNEADVA